MVYLLYIRGIFVVYLCQCKNLLPGHGRDSSPPSFRDICLCFGNRPARGYWLSWQIYTKHIPETRYGGLRSVIIAGHMYWLAGLADGLQPVNIPLVFWVAFLSLWMFIYAHIRLGIGMQIAALGSTLASYICHLENHPAQSNDEINSQKM